MKNPDPSLNAPSGAGCFLTGQTHVQRYRLRLNAPSGAGCFLTIAFEGYMQEVKEVLMHLLVLGAF